MRRRVDWLLRPLAWVACRVWGRHPARPERNPLTLAVFVVVAVTNTRTAVGVQALPASLAAVPDAFGRITALLIVIGAVIAVVGTLYRDDDYRLSIEQIGLALVGFGMLCYGSALISANPWVNASTPASLAYGVAIGTGARYAQIWWFQRRQRRQRPQQGSSR